MKLVVVRHGETVLNAQRRIQGQSESDLNERGLEQADAVAQALADTTLDGIYSSDLRRAVDTANAIARHHGVEVILDSRLREMAFGELEGLSWDEIGQHHPEAQVAMDLVDPSFVLPGGESRNALAARAWDFAEAIAEKHRGQTICAVSHGGWIGWFARQVLRIPPRAPSRLRSANCAYHWFERYEEGWFLRSWNERQHLSGK